MLNAVTFTPLQKTMFPGTEKFPFDIKVQLADEDRSDVFALRYRAYLDARYIERNAAATYHDRHDHLDSTVIISARDRGELVGALRICMSHPWQQLDTLPCASYYPELKALKREAGGGIAEMSRLAIDPSITNRSYRTTLYAALVRAGFIAARAAGVSHIVIATKSDWIRFYEYMLGFKPVGQPALYPPGDIPITLLAGSIDQAASRQRMQNAFFKITAAEIASMRQALKPALQRPQIPASTTTSA